MNNRQNGRRRGRGGQQARSGQPGGSPERGNRIDNRARGNAAQLLEKYKSLARDAQMQGDRVNTEYYLQFADHYFRVLSESRTRFEEQRPRRDDERDDEFDMGDEETFGMPERMGRNGQNGQNGAWSGDEERQPAAAPEPAYAEAPQPAPSQNGEDRSRDGERRPRRPRERGPARPAANTQDLADMADAAPARIEVDRIPGALAPVTAAREPELPVSSVEADGAGGEEAPRPRRRAPRRPRTEAPAAEA